MIVKMILVKGKDYFCTFFLIKKYKKIKKENLPAGKAGIYSPFLSCVLMKLQFYRDLSC